MGYVAPMWTARLALVLATSGILVACADADTDPESAGSASGGGGSLESGGAGGSAGEGGAGGMPAVDKSADCVDTFGDALTDSFGRVDGTVVAVVKPTDTHCPLFNDDHLVIELSMDGAVYRMVVNIDDIGYLVVDAPLVGGAWDEGWHTGATLDYASDLATHAEDFANYALAELADEVTRHLEIGAPLSVFAESSGGDLASSAHLVHRNNTKSDGAIVVDPTSSAPRYLLFRFANQQF